ncbi:M55 family metallopeptidase [Jeotgalibacillus proteolyticus]|uniref:Aminopeptidase n=1 Tax=Jeotgalibacillus proteolyticus TaxID=2082395 RepID=A0A2S5GA84_9BACL|nr:M55 family metallopeptidase [Jeotgalibacillus proteolyticus]PPA69831.1 aminopeptidase [Jeotgalibacillus proteolyticus]
MKVYLSVDMEGITGLPDYTYVSSNEKNYERGRRIMTREANYVIQAAFDQGATEVLVNDSHSKMNNLLIEELHPDAMLITGDVKPFSMVQGLDASMDAAIFIGYHARAGQKGVMSHAMTWGARNMYINDEPIGELGFNAYVAGFYGVPVVLVAGDDCVAKEADLLLKGVHTAAVKETISRSAVKSLTPVKAGELLTKQTALALQNRAQCSPLAPPENPVLKVEFTNYGEAEWASLMPGAAIIPGTCIVTYQAKTILEAYQAMLVMTELAMRTTFC